MKQVVGLARDSEANVELFARQRRRRPRRRRAPGLPAADAPTPANRPCPSPHRDPDQRDQGPGAPSGQAAQDSGTASPCRLRKAKL
jgi:hypothetical protein